MAAVRGQDPVRSYFFCTPDNCTLVNGFIMNTRRAMCQGGLSSIENEGIGIIQAILKPLIEKPKQFGETLCFWVPGNPIDRPGTIIYHDSMLKNVSLPLKISGVRLAENPLTTTAKGALIMAMTEAQ